MSGMRPRTNTLTSTQSMIIQDRWKCKMAEEKIEEAIHMIRRTTSANHRRSPLQL
nr:BV-like protein [Cotesia vestalis bracovirus]